MEAISEVKRRVLESHRADLESMTKLRDEYNQQKDKTSAEDTANRDRLQEAMTEYDKVSRIVNDNEKWIADAKLRIEGTGPSASSLIRDRNSLEQTVEVFVIYR